MNLLPLEKLRKREGSTGLVQSAGFTAEVGTLQ